DGVDIEDDDAGAARDLASGAADAAGQVHHRHHRAAQVDDAADEHGHQRDRGEGPELDDLADVEDVHGEDFAAELEGQVLPCPVRRLRVADRLLLHQCRHGRRAQKLTNSPPAPVAAAGDGPLPPRLRRGAPAGGAEGGLTWSRRKNSMSVCSCSAWLLISSAVAASSSDADAFCWVARVNWFIAALIWPTPPDCSLEAAAISCTRSEVRRIDGTIACSNCPAP